MTPYDDDLTRHEMLREQLIGLGERSLRKSYYPQLQQSIQNLKRFRALLDESYDLIFLLQLPDGIIVDMNDRPAGSSDTRGTNYYTVLITFICTMYPKACPSTLHRRNRVTVKPRWLNSEDAMGVFSRRKLTSAWLRLKTTVMWWL